MKISIITINKNNRAGLVKTVESVICQTCGDYEYIVVDGASDDGSEKIRDRYPRIDQFISEPDSGIYNAMNKGIRLAHGEYCLFLNSGDCLFSPDVLERVKQKISGCSYDVVSFRLMLPENDSYLPRQHYNYLYFQSGCIPHQATLIRTELFQRIGFYREDYRLISDFIFFFKALCLKKVSYGVFDIPFALYDLNGLSRNQNLINTEIRRYLREKEVPLIYRFIMTLRKLKAKILK